MNSDVKLLHWCKQKKFKKRRSYRSVNQRSKKDLSLKYWAPRQRFLFCMEFYFDAILGQKEGSWQLCVRRNIGQLSERKYKSATKRQLEKRKASDIPPLRRALLQTKLRLSQLTLLRTRSYDLPIFRVVKNNEMRNYATMHRHYSMACYSQDFSQ